MNASGPLSELERTCARLAAVTDYDLSWCLPR
jgi:hypothetical protein